MLTTILLATYEYLSQSEYWDLEPNNFFGATDKQILAILVVLGSAFYKLRSAFYKLINLRGKLKYLI